MEPVRPVACAWCFKTPVERCPRCHRWLCAKHASLHKCKTKLKRLKIKDGTEA